MKQLGFSEGWGIHCALLDKVAFLKYNKDLINKESIYNIMSKHAFDQIIFGKNVRHVNLSVDRSKQKKEIIIFNNFIQSNLKERLSSNINLYIEHEFSHNNPG